MLRQDVVDDVVRGNVFRFSLIREQDAVAQDIVGQVLDVLWSDEGTMVHEGIGAGRQSQVDGSAGRCPRADETAQLHVHRFRETGGAHQIHDVAAHGVVNINLVY